MNHPSRQNRFTHFSQKLGTWIETLSSHVWSWGLLFILIAMAPGLAISSLWADPNLKFVVDNKLAMPLRYNVLVAMILSALIMLVLYILGWWFYNRHSSSKLPFSEFCIKVNHFSFVLLTIPFFIALRHQGIESSNPFLTLITIAIVSSFLGVFIYRLCIPENRFHHAKAFLVKPWQPWACIVLMGLGYAIYLSHLAILDHHNLDTNLLDLAIYDNILWNTSHGNFLGCSFCAGGNHNTAHFDPILVVIVPLYLLVPRAETLLVFQSFWLASGIIPLFLLTKQKLDSPWIGVAFALAYLLYPALHGVNMYDFHSLALLIPSFLWAIYFLDTKANKRYWLALFAILLTREDTALLACFIGVYAILSRRPWMGFWTMIIALTYLIFVKSFLMPNSDLLVKGHFVGRYASMIPYPEENLKGLVISFFSNPVFVLKTLFSPEMKLFYYLALLGPLLFLPLFAGRKLILTLYGLIFIGLADLKYHYSLHFQYSAILFPVLFVALPDSIYRIRQSSWLSFLQLKQSSLTTSLVFTCLFASLLTSYKFGVLWPNTSFRAGWNRLDRNPNEERIQRYQFLREMIAEIPVEASVCATNSIAPHISNRSYATTWPRFEAAQFLLLRTDEMKPLQKRKLMAEIEKGKIHRISQGFGLELFVSHAPSANPTDLRSADSE